MSVNFLDIRFPPKISLGAEGGAEFLTDIVVTASGFETRNQNWTQQRMRFDVAHAARREGQWRELQAFFLVATGRAHSFRFKDWTDYVCASGDGIFQPTDTGSPTGQQMYKRYTFGGQTYLRKITKPVTSKITTDAVGLDYTTGVATSGTYWYGEFDLHARFDTDAMRSDTITRTADGELLVGWQAIPIIEVRE